MTYYDTIDEDLARARQILDKGRASRDAQFAERFPNPAVRAEIERAAGGTIFGADIYAAYKLLESFVAEVERLQARGQELEEDLQRAEAAAAALEEDRAALLPYVQHLPDCPRARDEDAPCACGLWAIPGQPHAGN